MATPSRQRNLASLKDPQRTFQSEMINDASQKHKASQRHLVCYIDRAVFQEPAGEILRSKQCISYHSTANYCKASKATHAESKRRRAEPPVIPGSYVYWGPSYARTQVYHGPRYTRAPCRSGFWAAFGYAQKAVPSYRQGDREHLRPVPLPTPCRRGCGGAWRTPKWILIPGGCAGRTSRPAAQDKPPLRIQHAAARSEAMLAQVGKSAH